ncbi:MAG: 30S ribosomal protein S9 [Chloroflexi bacterium]|nr:MAG: 30S ribosomal protein S9 [Chloroflexota bacterium]
MGRRKTAVARVRLFPNGDGSITVNGKNGGQYFGQRETLTSTVTAPLRLLEVSDTFNMSVRVVGGGSRMKERKKPGLKRARKAPQYTKRYSGAPKYCLARCATISKMVAHSFKRWTFSSPGLRHRIQAVTMFTTRSGT